MGAAAAVTAAVERQKGGESEPLAAPLCVHTTGSRQHARQRQLSSMETGPSPARVLTSHIQVGRGRVACACRVGRHTLVLALVRLFTALNLQGTCGDIKTEFRPGTWAGGLTAFVACADRMLQTSGPQPSASAASRKLPLTCPVVSWIKPWVALLGTILPYPTVPLDPSVPPGALPLSFNSTECPLCSSQCWSLSVSVPISAPGRARPHGARRGWEQAVDLPAWDLQACNALIRQESGNLPPTRTPQEGRGLPWGPDTPQPLFTLLSHPAPVPTPPAPPIPAPLLSLVPLKCFDPPRLLHNSGG